MLNRTVVLLFAFIALAANGVAAQSSHRFNVDVPFEFVLNGRTLPAGEYVIERTNAARPDIVTLKKKDGDFVRMIITQRVEKDEPSPTSSRSPLSSTEPSRSSNPKPEAATSGSSAKTSTTSASSAAAFVSNRLS